MAPEGRLRVAVDLTRARARPGSDDDFVLIGGDSLHIPVYDAMVRVEGAVNAPTAVAHRPGLGLTGYVAAAGGWAQDAMRGEAFVQQANGIIERGGTPGPGSTVVVPSKDLALEKPSIWPQVLSGVASIAATLTTIIVVLVR